MLEYAHRGVSHKLLQRFGLNAIEEIQYCKWSEEGWEENTNLKLSIHPVLHQKAWEI